MRPLIPLVLLGLFFASAASQSTEAPTGFDNKSNGVTDAATHQADQTTFEEVEKLSDGLGPLYNAQSCRECHQNPVSGAASQVTELRVGHLGPDGIFRNAEIPIAHGTEVITGRSLVNDRAICPNGAFPNQRDSGTSSRHGDDPDVPPFAQPAGRWVRRGRCRSNARRSCAATMQIFA